MHEVMTVGNVTAARRVASRLTPGGVILVRHGPMLVPAHGERSGEKRVHLSRDLHVLWRGSVAVAIQLPPITTDPGVLSRLLIAESRTPAYQQYDEAQVRHGMDAMKAVINNRLNNNPGQFNASNAATYADIITARGQFYGFRKNSSGKVALVANVEARINDVLTKANTGTPGKFYRFVQHALDVTSGGISDPFAGVTNIGGVHVTGGGYGWRTAGSSGPGGKFVLIPAHMGGVIQGNQFLCVKRCGSSRANLPTRPDQRVAGGCRHPPA
jgi:hypothetical protein